MVKIAIPYANWIDKSANDTFEFKMGDRLDSEVNQINAIVELKNPIWDIVYFPFPPGTLAGNNLIYIPPFKKIGLKSIIVSANGDTGVEYNAGISFYFKGNTKQIRIGGGCVALAENHPSSQLGIDFDIPIPIDCGTWIQSNSENIKNYSDMTFILVEI